MSIRLLVKERGLEGGAERASEVVLDGESIELGRDRSCQLVLPQQAVSRTHARISSDGPLYFIEDLGSSYGTLVNGQKLPKGEKRLLRNGDVIAIGQFDVVFDRALPKAAGAEGSASDTAQVARQLVREVMRGLAGTTRNPYLRVMNGPKEGQRIELQEAQQLVVGRDETADIVFRDDLVSRLHAKIRRDWAGVHVEDLQSRNGIKVNKRRATQRTLKDQDELEIGGIRLLYIDPNEVHDEPPMPRGSSAEPASPDDAPEPAREEGDPEGDEDEEEPTQAAPPTPVESPAEGGAELMAEAAPDDAREGALSEQDVGADDSRAAAGSEAESGDGEGQPEDLAGDEGSAEPQETGFLAGKRHFIPIVAVGVFALAALGVVVAVLVGA